MRAHPRDPSGSERLRLCALAATVVVLHVAGWGLFLAYSPRHPALAGLGLTAYLFGLRHAFDVDHVAAIDNTTRRLMQRGGRPLGVGFFFSLGHSSVVLTLGAATAVGARAVGAHLGALEHWGAYAGAAVSGGFLWIAGLLNLIVLADLVRIFRGARDGSCDGARLEARLEQRGLLARLLGRAGRLVSRSWHMYPLGVLFGLGFDTAGEIALLALAAGVAAHAVPFLAILSLPLLFAAGMVLMDTLDGVMMTRAYGWAFSSPVRKLYYNISVTTLSVAVALAVGSVQLGQVAAGGLSLDGAFWRWLGGLDFQALGYAIVAVFLLTWAASVAVWKLRRIEERWAPAAEELERPLRAR